MTYKHDKLNGTMKMVKHKTTDTYTTDTVLIALKIGTTHLLAVNSNTSAHIAKALCPIFSLGTEYQ